MSDFEADVNRGWGRLKAIWEGFTQEHKWKVLFLVSFGCNLGQFFF